MDFNYLIEAALKEDCPSGDLTTQLLGLPQKLGYARLIAKEDLIISGTELFEKTIASLDPHMEIQWSFKDAEMVYKNQIVAVIRGDLIPLLRAERVALNFLGHLSGIASLTRCFVKEVEGTGCKILDTRKTTPGYRIIEKLAVRHGGGENHRLHLSDTVLVKENHIYLSGGLKNVIGRLQKHRLQNIEVEVTNPSTAQEAAHAGATRLLLDNMSNQDIAACIKKTPSEIILEASGNMGIERVRSVAELGVHYISVGALTHSAPCADFSLQFYGKEQ